MKISAFILQQLQRIVGEENIFTDELSLSLNAYDCSLSRTRPDAVIQITNGEQIAPLLRFLYEHNIPFVPRASATNHAGSCSALNGGIILNLTPLNKIFRIDTQNQWAEAQAGTITGELQRRLDSLGFFYAPDPASEQISTLGGNLAQNASGARCMKYGGTIDNVEAVDFVFPDGKELHFDRQTQGPDWVGFLAGSEGTLGIIKNLRVKILPKPAIIQTFLVTFSSLEDCVQTVSDLAAKGIIPRCVEAMDDVTTLAVERFSHAGYPKDAQALLILELDGNAEENERNSKILREICNQNRAHNFYCAANEKEREKLWKGRRAAYASMASLAPNVMVGDGTVPRSELPRALKRVREILNRYGIYASLLFHAGDGNLHPQIIFDERNKPDALRVTRAVKEILQACVDCGGTVSGEHGIGVEKRAVMAYQYEAPVLRLFSHIKKAIDPKNLANPLKIIPLNYAEKARPSLPPSYEEEVFIQKIVQRRKAQLPCLVTGMKSKLKSQAENTLSTLSLNKIIEIDKQNYVVTAQAGVSLKNLIRTLEKEKVYCALPDEEGSLGGAYCSGCFPHFYSHVLGVEAILPNGDLVRYGGKLMKNAAGYNLCRLFAGSQGTLGLVTRITFKIFAHPVPVIKKSFSKPKANYLWSKIKKELDPLVLFRSLEENDD